MKHFTLFTMALALCCSIATAQSTSNTRAITTDYPFTVTTDAANPVLYFIFSGRDSQGGTAPTYVFQNSIPWGDTEYKLQIMRQDPRNFPDQLWYFMEGEDGLMIISLEGHRMITVASTTDGAKKIQMQTAEERTNKYYTWKLDLTSGCYAFKTSDGKSYLSHYGNWTTGGPQMGLYNANGAQDEGSRLFFEALPIEDYPAGITAPTATQQAEAIYNIAGQRIHSITAPGIYIINGKKVVINNSGI